MFTPGFRQFVQQRFAVREPDAPLDSRKVWNAAKGVVQDIGAVGRACRAGR